jgi:hypothetical protein
MIKLALMGGEGGSQHDWAGRTSACSLVGQQFKSQRENVKNALNFFILVSTRGMDKIASPEKEVKTDADR